MLSLYSTVVFSFGVSLFNLGYVDNSLVAPHAERASTAFDYAASSARIERLMDQLGIARDSKMGVRGERGTSPRPFGHDVGLGLGEGHGDGAEGGEGQGACGEIFERGVPGRR
jgi:hypothetical protein